MKNESAKFGSDQKTFTAVRKVHHHGSKHKTLNIHEMFGLLKMFRLLNLPIEVGIDGRTLFLTLAWFWFLAPTQNPWYWSWALVFIPFARNRLWLAVSGLSLLYYLRFWFLYHIESLNVLGSGYRGTDFFDIVILWVEFGPFLVVLWGASAIRWLNEFHNPQR